MPIHAALVSRRLLLIALLPPAATIALAAAGSPTPPLPQPALFLPCWANASLRVLPYCEPALPVDVRARDLVSRMTVEEKFSQFGIAGHIAEGGAIVRLGIPNFQYHSEGLHGVRTACIDFPGVNSTLFPQVTGIAATGNRTLMEAIAAVTASEARALNNLSRQQNVTFDKGAGLSYWSPTMNIGQCLTLVGSA